MTTYKTLQELLRKSKGKEIKVKSRHGTIAVIKGVVEAPFNGVMEQRAFGYLVKIGPFSVRSGKASGVRSSSAGTLPTFYLDREHWILYKEPKPTAHYQAVCKDLSSGLYSLTSELYSSESVAREANGNRFVRLATEFGATYLPVEQ